MKEPVNYSLSHTTATVNLTLTDKRFIAETRGKGALDKLRTIDIPFSDLKKFCLAQTISPQNLESIRTEGDHSYDSEFIFSYLKDGNVKNKRVFVNSCNESFVKFINELKRNCSEASLLHISPAEAQKQMGVIPAIRVAKIFIGLLIGIPVLIALIFVITKMLRH